nr:MAG TPA: hypothetical protein [Caudoviricetes sp.]
MVLEINYYNHDRIHSNLNVNLQLIPLSKSGKLGKDFHHTLHPNLLNGHQA